MNRLSSHRQKQAIIVTLTLLLGMACGLQWVNGQAATPYYQAPYDKTYLDSKGALDERLIRQETVVKGQILLGALPFAENANRFKLWYTGYQFRAFSHLDQLHKLPARRKEIVDDLGRAKSKEIHDALLAITDQYMKIYVTATKQNIHPAVRFNAMLVIGDLNAEEKGFQNRYERPLPSALDFLLQEYENPAQTDAIRLAAMIGILRHTQLNWARTDPNTKIPAAQQQKIAQLMLTLVTTKEPPAGRTPEGHVWMQRRGVEILAALGLIGTTDVVNQAITGLIADHSADMSLRCTAAAALYSANQPKTPVKSKIDPAKESLQLAALLVEACRRQLDKMDAVQKKQQGPMGSMGGYGAMPGGYGGMSGGPGGSDGGVPGMPGMMPGMGGSGGLDGGLGLGGYGGAEDGSGMGMGMGMSMASPKDPLTELFRRQIKYEIDCVKRGLEGIGRLAGQDPRKPAFPDLNKDVDEVWKATDPPAKATSHTIATLHKGLKDSLKPLESKTAALLPKAKEPAAETGTEPDVPADVPPAAPDSAPVAGAPPGTAPPASGGGAPPAAAAPGDPPAAAPAPPAPGNPGPANPAPADPGGDAPPA